MLTTVIQLQQGVISDKACDDLSRLFRRSWMHTRCRSRSQRPKSKDATMSSPAFRDGHQRPELPRLRSNSVPIAVTLMDCTAEEAGLIFSAAERASARRRKAQSFDQTAMTPGEVEPQVDVGMVPDEDAGEDDFDSDTLGQQTPPRQRVVSLSPSDPESVPQVAAPMASPSSPGIKTYNDDMVKFVKQRLLDIADKFYTPPPEEYTQYEQEPLWPVTPQRPTLQSHFSNWSTISTADDAVDTADLASSPPASTEDDSDSIEDEDVEADEPDDVDASDNTIEKGYAHVVQFRQRADMQRSSSPNYFSWPARSRTKAAPAHHRITFDTPITADFRMSTGHEQAASATTTPLIDLDAVQPDVSRASRGTDFFDFGFRNSGQLTPSPSPGAALATIPMHMGQHLPSPQPIRC